MAIGTAGLTSMLCVMALERHGVTPDAGPVLVTGAAGGVGSVAIAILAALGYEVLASSGRGETEGGYLRSLGAAEVIDRSELSEPGRPMGKERWAAAIDTVGSHTLANVLAQTRYGGTVAACGLAQGMDLPASVAPFILRGVTLAGVDSVMAPAELAYRGLGPAGLRPAPRAPRLPDGGAPRRRRTAAGRRHPRGQGPRPRRADGPLSPAVRPGSPGPRADQRDGRRSWPPAWWHRRPSRCGSRPCSRRPASPCRPSTSSRWPGS